MTAELDAFVDACRALGPDAVSACPGWTTREVAAHQAATGAEIVRHLDPVLAGDPVPETQSFEQREAPFRTLDFDELLDRVVAEDATMHGAVTRMLAAEPDAAVPWTGRQMAVATFPTHVRSEFALHRRDLVGDDEVGTELLADPALTDHAVNVLGAILPRAGAASDPGGAFSVALRSAGTADVVVEAGPGGARLRRAEEGEEVPVGLESDPAARLLTLWGRLPAGRCTNRLFADQLLRLQRLLVGY